MNGLFSLVSAERTMAGVMPGTLRTSCEKVKNIQFMLQQMLLGEQDIQTQRPWGKRLMISMSNRFITEELAVK